MSQSAISKRSMGITLRTALLSWLVTLMTLLVFVLFIVPQQKRTFLESLDSKAHSVAVSLRDVAAGAAINEDYSSVVDHSKEMINGDHSLFYIIITRNDGFSLIHDREGWRAETNAGKEWRPDVRESSGGIGRVPLFDERIYYYSQPFDYSAIKWGWIHVGLSLEGYNRNVADLYRTTAWLSLGCIFISLIASVIYAKRLVKPILGLQKVVLRVAHGDMKSRAIILRGDEIGALSASVNNMTETLWRRDRILESVRRAAQQFLSTNDWESIIEVVLANIGDAAHVCRIVIYQVVSEDGKEIMYRRHRWVAPAFLPSADPSQPPERVEPLNAGFREWIERLRAGELILSNTSDLNGQPEAALRKAGVKSSMVIPIFAEGQWWGSLTLEDCSRDRAWEPAEQNSIRAAVDMLGSTIARQRAQSALVEANNTLEQRVAERTQELVAEVAARKQAHAELADAQHRLIKASRQAGMAEIATGVLHNVGNVLNSVNVSSSLMLERLQNSEVRTLSRVADLLDENQHDLLTFINQDKRGQRLPAFLIKLTKHIEQEHAFYLEEHAQLGHNIEHIKEIVAMQQNYAKVSGFIERVQLSDLINDALRINVDTFDRHGIKLNRQFDFDPVVTIDKHKVLQILINLLQNAKQAVQQSDNPTKTVRLATMPVGENRVQIQVTDNGIGIDTENLNRIFAHGFTTKQKGHGFGLHSGANFAREMGGKLSVTSPGVNCGATFTLELGLNTEENTS